MSLMVPLIVMISPGTAADMADFRAASVVTVTLRALEETGGGGASGVASSTGNASGAVTLSF